MTVRNLKYLFRPTSVAVVGASDRPQSLGATVMRNLLAGGYAGSIFPVNPKHASVAGIRTVPDVGSLEQAPDLAVICTPPHTIPGIIHQLGAKGGKAAVVLTAGLGAITNAQGRTLTQAMLDAAKPHLLRILGPNCVGLLAPTIGLNASFAHIGARPGRIAFVSQSGALTTALLDWTDSRGIGFSHFISLGDSADVDFGDVLDYLASDAATTAILLYVEAITNARKFMSAARAAARNKQVIAVKSGRVAESAKAAASHTGALAGSDDVYDAAFRRAGMLRVESTFNLFVAAETLALVRPFRGDRLTIMTNGGGPAVMATDALIRGGGRLAQLADETLQRLNQYLPATWSRANPVDIVGDAPAERYVRTLQDLLADPQSDAVLLIHAPTAIVPSDAIAAACVPVARAAQRSVLSCWLGAAAVEKARRTFIEAGLPSYDTPEDAVYAFLKMEEFRRNQESLMQTPPSTSTDFGADVDAARTIVGKVLNEGREILTEVEAKDVLQTYGIPVVTTRIATSPEEAVRLADEMGFPVALKILSPDVTHKSDVGGVALNLDSGQAVREAAQAMEARLRRLRPHARLTGFTVQPMAQRPGAYELIVGATTDATFGPVILFGQGGTAVEVIADRAVALPPLNVALACEVISRTRISRLLAGYRDRPAANLDAICSALIRTAQLIADIPQIVELDINPLLADTQGVIALDARIRVTPARTGGSERFAIRPYPQELEESITVSGTPILLRPIRPEDEARLKQLIAQCRPEDIYFRFFTAIRELPHSQLARFTQIDYDREMAFVAIGTDNELLGKVRTVTDPDNEEAEFGILVGSSAQGKGLGHALLDKMIRYCRARGTKKLVGDVLPTNSRMLALAENLHFERGRAPGDGVVGVSLRL
ncbi:MAG TPA: bifunctional acetate--CoA ligase family protein/GNAT family N-acetyltransferase [Burkholderiales bacterium]|jgi:acetyltransferase|nr:bifunctional acetate--CoA ligase family protein/GNAT family N-acetyltransferase [Burkholderiales bacterium]